MIPDYPTDQDVALPRQGHWAQTVHRFNPRDAVALRAAEACGRPLLIRGKPGVGKSQAARAAAAAAGRPLLSVVIDGRSEAPDLMWRFDAVRRLADAQRQKAADQPLPAEDFYVRPEALWWAFDWAGALQWLQDSGQPLATPVDPPAFWAPGQPAVLLIDEIDKADPDLPNALLDVLANNGFRKPFGGPPVQCAPAARPLIIITTNEERELPAAFLRRCLVLTLALPAKEDAFCDYLEQMGLRHQAVRLQTEPTTVCHVLRPAAQRLWAARQQLGDGADYLPGLAEYLDLVTALARLYPGAQLQADQLDALQDLAYRKG